MSAGAAVFMDGAAAELLHWSGGARVLPDCLGVFDLYADLSAVARDFIAKAYAHDVFRSRDLMSDHVTYMARVRTLVCTYHVWS